jgi:hypothetical protein
MSTQEVKLPEGTTIDPPVKEKDNRSRIPQFMVAPDLPQIIYPHYTNNNKTELACILVQPGPNGPGTGQTVREGSIPKDDKHPLYADIKKQFTEDEILHNTEREARLRSEYQKAAEEEMHKQKQSKQREDLWEIKQEFLNMDLVKQEANREWRRKIRKATTVIMAQSYGIACIIKDAEQSE